MISLSELTEAGKFLKPHGVNGEIAILRYSDTIDFETVKCIVTDIDGIYVPFFLTSVRPKGAETDLVTVEGMDTDAQVASLVNKPVYILRSDLPEDEATEDEEGLYADDMVGFTILLPDGNVIGIITAIEDSTANYLFITETPEGKILLIPIAEEYILTVDPVGKTITMDIPEGLLDMQKQ